MSRFCTVPIASGGVSVVGKAASAASMAEDREGFSSSWFVDSPSRQPDLVKILDDSVFVSQQSRRANSSSSGGSSTEHFLVINDFSQDRIINLFDEKFEFSNDVDENVVKYRAPLDLHYGIKVSSIALDSSTPIQCLANRGNLVAAVNSSNDVFLTKLSIDAGAVADDDNGEENDNSDNSNRRAKQRKINAKSKYNFDSGAVKHQLSTGTSPKSGWVGLNLTGDSFVTAGYLSKSLLWNDLETGRQKCAISLLSHPTALFQQRDAMSSVSNSSISSSSSGGGGGASASSDSAYVCEGGVFSAWDGRTGRLVIRESVSKSALWTIDKGIESGGNEYDLYLGGVDRNVYVYDIRKWKCRLKWKAPCKFDITKLLLVNSSSSSSNSSSINSSVSNNSSSRFFLGGGDNEVLLCDSAMKYLQVGSSDVVVAAATMPTGSVEDNNNNNSSNSNSNSDNNQEAPASSKLRLSHHRGIRSEARWAGLDARWCGQSGSVIVGMCEIGNYYVLQSGQLMTVSNNSNCVGSV